MDFNAFSRFYNVWATERHARGYNIPGAPQRPKKASSSKPKDDVVELQPAPVPDEPRVPVILAEILAKGPTHRRKFRLWEETGGTCVYCGKSIPLRDFMTGVDSDIEHIIPAALGGSSTFENLACSCRICNREKGDLTSIDYMLTKPGETLQGFLKRLRLLAAAGQISLEKYVNLTKPKALLEHRL